MPTRGLEWPAGFACASRAGRLRACHCRPCAQPAAGCRPSQLLRPEWRSKRARRSRRRRRASAGRACGSAPRRRQLWDDGCAPASIATAGQFLPPERGAAPAPRSIGIDCSRRTDLAALKLVVLAVHPPLKLVVLAVHPPLKLVVLAVHATLKRVAVDAYMLKQACRSHGGRKREGRRRDAAAKNEQA